MTGSNGSACPIACPLCGASWAGGRPIRLGDASVSACRSCRNWIYWPRPSSTDQAALHDKDAYFHHPYFEKRRRSPLAAERRCRRVMERIKRYIPGGSFGGKVLVDVGCDTGELLDQARRLYGVRPIGIDVSRAAVKQAAAKGIETYCGQLDKAPPTLRDIPFMTAIDLIEHLADPGQFLEEVKKRLGNEGLLYLEMPNRASWVYRTGGGLSHLTDGQPKALFERLFPAEHLQYFSPEGFREWSQNRGFRVLDLRTLSLPASDIAVSWPILAGLSVLQGLDRLSGRGCRILISAVLKNESGS